MRSFSGNAPPRDGVLNPGRVTPGSWVGGTVTDVPLWPPWPVFTDVPPGSVDLCLGHPHGRRRERLGQVFDRLGGVLDRLRDVLHRVSHVSDEPAVVTVADPVHRLRGRQAHELADRLDGIARAAQAPGAAALACHLPRTKLAGCVERPADAGQCAVIAAARPAGAGRDAAGGGVPRPTGALRARRPDPTGSAGSAGIARSAARVFPAAGARVAHDRNTAERQLPARSLVGHSGAAGCKSDRDQDGCCLAGERGAVLDHRGRGLAQAAASLAEPAAQERRERQQRAGAVERPAHAAGLETQHERVEPHGHGVAPAWLAALQMAGKAAAVTRAGAALRDAVHGSSHALTAGPGVDLVEPGAQAATGPEQQALDRAAREPHAAPDAVVGKALQLPHHEDLVLRGRKVVECHAQRVELVPARDVSIRTAGGLGDAALLDRAEVVRVDRHLLRAPGAAEVVDAGVLRDLVDPGPEDDLLVGAAQGPQGGHEGLLHDVLRPPVVGHHSAHVADHAVAVPAEQRLERLVAALPGGCDQLIVGRLRGRRCHQRFHRGSPTSS